MEPPGAQLMTARVRAGTQFEVAAVQPLFHPQGGELYLTPNWSYDVDGTGNRFLASRRHVESAVYESLVLTTGFFTELRERVGGGR